MNSYSTSDDHFLRDTKLTHALHLTKQAIILLAVLHATLVAFILQIIHNTFPPLGFKCKGTKYSTNFQKF